MWRKSEKCLDAFFASCMQAKYLHTIHIACRFEVEAVLMLSLTAYSYCSQAKRCNMNECYCTPCSMVLPSFLLLEVSVRRQHQIVDRDSSQASTPFGEHLCWALSRKYRKKLNFLFRLSFLCQKMKR